MGKCDLFGKTFQKMMVQLRQEKLLTQKYLSSMVGLSRQFISQMESGDRKPSFETFCKLAWGLGITPVKLSEKFLRLYEQEKLLEEKLIEKNEAAQYIKNVRNIKDS